MYKESILNYNPPRRCHSPPLSRTDGHRKEKTCHQAHVSSARSTSHLKTTRRPREHKVLTIRGVVQHPVREKQLRQFRARHALPQDGRRLPARQTPTSRRRRRRRNRRASPVGPRLRQAVPRRTDERGNPRDGKVDAHIGAEARLPYVPVPGHSWPVVPSWGTIPYIHPLTRMLTPLRASDELGKVIQPAFLALSGTVITVNLIVGGSLTVVSGLVNGLFLAIAAGIAYLGKLASDDQREKAGGPQGPVTLNLAKVLGVLLKILGHGSVDDSGEMVLSDWMEPDWMVPAWMVQVEESG